MECLWAKALIIIQLLRIKQWTKNLLVYAAPLFAGKLFVPAIFNTSSLCFILFCLTASGLYILNDISDLETDRLHPKKCRRPIASGRVSKPLAICICAIILVVSFLLAGMFIGVATLGILIGYFILNILYTYKLKKIPVLDVACIAGGFVLRAVSGGVATKVPLSPWFILCVIFISLFLALAKRRHEIMMLDDNAENHRQVLGRYSLPYLDQLIGIVSACTIMTYALYTFESNSNILKNGLVWTVPLVIYGLFRYLYLVHIQDAGGAPEDILIGDSHILLTVIIYVAIVVYTIYFNHLTV